jgi:hypothetical protein
MKGKFWFLLVVVMVMFSLSSCYIGEQVSTNQVGIQLNENRIQNIVGPGIYNDWGYFADLKVIDVDTLTFSVEDPEVLTSNNQIVGVKLTIQARRKNDSESVKNIVTNWNSLTNNENLVNTISATAREGIKNGVRGFTLTQLLDDRNGLATAISDQLKVDTAKYSADIINVTVENVSVHPDYVNLLNERTLIDGRTDNAKKQQDLIKQEGNNKILQAQTDTNALAEQLKAEKAKTDVEVEIARRSGEVTKQQNQVYVTNPQAFELEKLRLLQAVLSGDTIYWLPVGTDLTTIFNGTGNNLIPMPSK